MIYDPTIYHVRACRKCGTEYPETAEFFTPHKNCTAGLVFTCRKCKSAQDKIYRQENADKIRVTQRAWQQANPEKVNEYSRDWRKKNPEKRHQSIVRYGIAHKDRTRRAVDRWQAANPDKMRKTRVARRTRSANLPSTFTETDWQFAVEYFGGRCVVCGRVPDFWHTLGADHWIPLSDPRPDNPGAVPTNMVPLCHSTKGVMDGDTGCNNQKHKRDALKWLTEKYGERKARQIMKRIAEFFEAVKNHTATASASTDSSE